MRLWHIYSLRELPGRLLASLHRDLCNIRANPKAISWKPAWGCGDGFLWYHRQVLHEMRRRGWKPAPEWDRPEYRGKKKTPISGLLLCDEKTIAMTAAYYYADMSIDALEQDRAEIQKWKEARNGYV